MRIDYKNKFIIDADISLHDAVLEKFNYDCINNKVSIELDDSEWRSRKVSLAFSNVLYFEMLSMDLWGKSPYIYDWELVDINENVMNLCNDKFENPGSKNIDKCFQTAFTLSSGNKLNIICEYIDFTESNISDYETDEDNAEGFDTVNNDQNILKMQIDKAQKEYCSQHPDSLIPCFEEELRKLGFNFEISNQALRFMPKYKETILPIAIKYYQSAKKQKKYNEQSCFMCFFRFEGFDEVVPMLLKDFYSDKTPELTRWTISDCIFMIKSKNYIGDYLNIISNPKFGENRQMIILLVGELKAEPAIPILIDLLEDESVRSYAIKALSDFKKEEFRPYFERFQNSKNIGWQKYARSALKNLES